VSSARLAPWKNTGDHSLWTWGPRADVTKLEAIAAMIASAVPFMFICSTSS
jgi:hypothetical protein